MSNAAGLIERRRPQSNRAKGWGSSRRSVAWHPDKSRYTGERERALHRPNMLVQGAPGGGGGPPFSGRPPSARLPNTLGGVNAHSLYFATPLNKWRPELGLLLTTPMIPPRLTRSWN